VIEALAPLVALLLLNSPFWFLQQFYFVMRPVFSIDLLLVAVVCAFSLRVGVPMLLLAWALDGLLVASFSYHFGTASEFLSSFHFANALGLRHFVTPTLLGVLLLFLVTGAIAMLALHKPRRSVRNLLAWAFLICLFDVMNGSTQLFGLGQDQFRVPMNVAGSPAWNLGVTRARARENSSLPMAPAVQTSAFNAISRWQAIHPGSSMLVIIVESMGIPNAPILQSWLEQQLFTSSVRSRWATSSSIERFSGTTTFGELRVLCGLSGHYTRLNQNTASGCLPARFAVEGYATTGMHGFTSQMFDRAEWWPSIGMGSRLFAEQLARREHLCGDAFPGVCDDYMVALATKQADQPKQFVYLLTLNTHLPLVPSPIPQDLLHLCATASVGDSACQLISQLGTLLRAVATSMQGVKQPPFVAVVGDHAPPFNAIVDRSSFNQKNVPLYLLTPLD
jgi:hypothetical protein